MQQRHCTDGIRKHKTNIEIVPLRIDFFVHNKRKNMKLSSLITILFYPHARPFYYL